MISARHTISQECYSHQVQSSGLEVCLLSNASLEDFCCPGPAESPSRNGSSWRWFESLDHYRLGPWGTVLRRIASKMNILVAWNGDWTQWIWKYQRKRNKCCRSRRVTLTHHQRLAQLRVQLGWGIRVVIRRQVLMRAKILL
jgi:hypothetical protein